MPSQLFSLKRYFGGKTSQGEEFVTLTDGQTTREAAPPIPNQPPIQPVQAVGNTLNPPIEPVKQQDLSLSTPFSNRVNTTVTIAAQEAAQTKQTSIEHDTYEIDLTKRARNNMLDPVVNREKEIEQIIHILLRRTKNNPVLVGERGVGKTAIVEALAQKMVKGEVPIDLRDKRIINFDLTTLVTGTSHQGEFEERLKRFIKELKDTNDVILFIDGIHTIVGVSTSEGALDASNILKPFLARGEIQLIATSRIEDYQRFIEKNPLLERRFQQILVEEPTTEETIIMLSGIRHKYESFHSVTIPDNTIEAAVKLSSQYIGGCFLPDKAVDLIDEAAAKIRMTQKEGKENVVTPEDIIAIVSSRTGIPVTRLSETESERLLNLEKLIHESFIDQEGAVSAVAEAVRRGRTGLMSTNRPIIGSFLFMGPTGVGKTELAKTLAFVLFGSEAFMFRLDMNEYMEKREFTKLIGIPFGYIGYEEGGQLTGAARTMPYSVILLDALEKAHPDVFSTLIQIFEDGRLTDNKGRIVSFKNAIIIATSNVGTALIQKQDTANLTKQAITSTTERDQEKSGSSTNQNPQEAFALLAQKLLEELRKFFTPELLNRFDEIIFFKPLTKENMLSIATLGIDNTKRLLSEQKISLEITSGALSKLSELGASPLFGARPLRRIIQTHIENPISTLLIQKVFQETDTILVDYDTAKSAFVFGKKPTPETTIQAEEPLPVPQPIPVQTPPVVPSQGQSDPPSNPFAGIAQTIPLEPFNQNQPMPSSEIGVHT